MKSQTLISLENVWKVYQMGQVKVPAYKASKLKPVDALRYE